jgi:hypothetical protein
VNNLEQILFGGSGTIPSVYRGVASPKYGGSVRSRGWGRHRILRKHMPADDRSDPLRELATECVALAERTTDPAIRAKLLLIAQKWITMANTRLAVTELSDETPLAPK